MMRRPRSIVEPSAVVIESEMPGPTVVIVAGVHGDELIGVVAARQLQAVTLSRGRLVVFQAVNEGALAQITRTSPADDVDLNRAFPGKRRGGHTSRLAFGLMESIQKFAPDLVIDLHSDSECSVPYVLIDTAISKRGHSAKGESVSLAKSTGLFCMREYSVQQYRRSKMDCSLTGAMLNRLGTPALTFEVGPKRRIDTASVEVAKNAVICVLAALDMVNDAPIRGDFPGIMMRRAPALVTPVSGLLSPLVKPGQPFEVGQTVAEVASLSSGGHSILAPYSGVVAAWREDGWVTAGQTLGTFATSAQPR